jgi:microcystin-dependent protein
MSEPFLGEIRMFGGNFAPRGWAMCNGQLLTISQNTALFSLLGTTYGGDGVRTFGLPNLQGRAPLHSGQGPGLSLRDLGETGGEQTVTLLTNQLPSHKHVVNCTNNTTADRTAPTGGLWAPGAGRRGQKFYASAAANGAPLMSPQALPLAGGSQPHNNMPPYLVVTFIIALQGIYPSRN